MSDRKLLIGATFTATPLAALLKEQGVAEVAFTPYNQLLQSLVRVDEGTQGKAVVLLLRAADLVRRERGTPDELAALLAQRIGPWLDALRTFFAQQVPVTHLLVVPSPALSGASGALAEACQHAERQLNELPNCRVLRWPDFMAAAVEAASPFDAVADKLGHVPFTTECFEALARWLAAQVRHDAAAPVASAAPPAAPAGDPLQRFFERLQLRMLCRPLAGNELLPEAVRLSHTAATFHMTARSATEASMSAQFTQGVNAGAIEVSDRFGRYGFGGFVLCRTHGEWPVVAEFVLNCVVLGKQVEHGVVLALAWAAQAAGCQRLGFSYQDKGANRPAIEFLLGLGAVAGAESRPAAEGGLELSVEPERLAQAVLAEAKAPEALAASAKELDFAALFAREPHLEVAP